MKEGPSINQAREKRGRQNFRWGVAPLFATTEKKDEKQKRDLLSAKVDGRKHNPFGKPGRQLFLTAFSYTRANYV